MGGGDGVSLPKTDPGVSALARPSAAPRNPQSKPVQGAVGHPCAGARPFLAEPGRGTRGRAPGSAPADRDEPPEWTPATPSRASPPVTTRLEQN